MRFTKGAPERRLHGPPADGARAMYGVYEKTGNDPNGARKGPFW